MALAENMGSGHIIQWLTPPITPVPENLMLSFDL